MNSPNVERLMDVTNRFLKQKYQTELVKGHDEPVYFPADKNFKYHRIIFAHGFFSSALHELAHWCIAGKERRWQEDYGYWYVNDGRNHEQQGQFEKVEIKPQAIEWALSLACGTGFQVSCDNLDGVEPDRVLFRAKVYQQLHIYMNEGFPSRAQELIDLFCDFFGQPPLQLSQFDC